MADLVAIEEVADALRMTLGASTDVDLAERIAQASDIVRDYVNNDPEATYWDSDTAPPRVKAATIMVVRCLLDDTDESLAMLTGLSGATPDPRNPITALLWRLRDPVLA